MNLSFLNIILLIGGVQGLFLALLLFRRKVSNQLASNYLSILVASVASLMLAKVVFNPSWMYRFPELILLPDVVLYAIGPCIWLFVRQLLRLPRLSNRRLFLHALPALFYVFVVDLVLAQHIRGNWSILKNAHVIFSFYAIEGFGILSISTYLLKSLKLLGDQQIDHQMVTSEVIQFLKIFFKIGLSMAAAWGLSFIIHIVKFDPEYLAYQIFWALLVAYVYWLAYVVLLRPQIFELPPVPKNLIPIDHVRLQKLRDYMDEHKPYLEPSLKIGDLAKLFELPSHELSKLINHGFKLSFFDFINSYRIKAFISLWNNAPEAERSILQLAYQVGFNSKSSFNRAFRKMLGTSPSQYFKQTPSTPMRKTGS